MKIRLICSLLNISIPFSFFSGTPKTFFLFDNEVSSLFLVKSGTIVELKVVFVLANIFFELIELSPPGKTFLFLSTFSKNSKSRVIFILLFFSQLSSKSFIKENKICDIYNFISFLYINCFVIFPVNECGFMKSSEKKESQYLPKSLVKRV